MKTNYNKIINIKNKKAFKEVYRSLLLKFKIFNKTKK